MIKLLLNDHKTFEWYQFNETTYVRGMFFTEKDEYCEKDDLSIFGKVSDEITFEKRLSEINGTYAIIYNDKTKTYFAVDRISSLPLFYAIKNNNLYISDSVKKIQEELKYYEIDEDTAREFLAAGFTTGKRTLFKGIYMLEAGQYAIADIIKENIFVKNYFLHHHNEENVLPVIEHIKMLDDIVLDIFRRQIKSFNGRPVVLFLSGGYDSRLIAVTLKRLEYKNVICFTFGADSLKDVKCAVEVAKSLNFPLVRLDAKKKWFHDFQKTDNYIKGYKENTYGYAIQYIQGLLLSELIETGIIPKDAIVITGNSGDVLEGNDVSLAFKKDTTYSFQQIAKAIIDQHYWLQGKHLRDYPVFLKYVKDVISDKDIYTYEEAQDIFEFFNWRTRQARYVINDVTCYNETLGLDWRLPLWDDKFVSFWLNIPIELRYKRKLYYEYVNHEEFPTANNDSFVRKVINWFKRVCPSLINFFYRISKPLQLKFLYEADIFYFYGLITKKEQNEIFKYTKCYQLNGLTCLARVTFNTVYRKYSNDLNDILDI